MSLTALGEMSDNTGHVDDQFVSVDAREDGEGRELHLRCVQGAGYMVDGTGCGFGSVSMVERAESCTCDACRVQGTW